MGGPPSETQPGASRPAPSDAPAAAAPAGLQPSDWASIHGAYERHRYQVVPVAGQGHQWRARNPGQQWQTRFDERGFIVEPDGGGWTWGLEFLRYGVAGTEHEVGPKARIRAETDRLTYTWDTVVDEWFVNDPRGLEHGFTLRERPAGGDGPVALWLGVRGGLRPRVQPAGNGVVFVDAQDASVVTYTGLTVVDADNRKVPAWFEPAGEALRLVVDDGGARYPVTIDPFAQQAYVKASNTGAGHLFGYSVAVSGDTVMVGAYGETSNATGIDGDQTNNTAFEAGAAYAFTFTTGSGEFFTVAPCRVLDTRNPIGSYGGPALVAGTDRTFAVAGQCGVPSGAAAVAVNLAVTQPGAAGNLRRFPAGNTLPLVSSINYSAGQMRSNNAIIPLNALGEMAVRCAQPSGTAHFILDVNGYFE